MSKEFFVFLVFVILGVSGCSYVPGVFINNPHLERKVAELESNEVDPDYLESVKNRPRLSQEQRAIHNEYVTEIKDKITRKWNIPEKYRAEKINVAVALILDEKGKILSLNVKKNNSDRELVLSLLRAIVLSEPLPMPVDNKVNRHFRNITLLFLNGENTALPPNE